MGRALDQAMSDNELRQEAAAIIERAEARGYTVTYMDDGKHGSYGVCYGLDAIPPKELAMAMRDDTPLCRAIYALVKETRRVDCREVASRRHSHQASSSLWFEVTNDLMAPRFRKGEAVEVDPDLAIEAGRDAAIVREGTEEMTFARVVSIHEDRLIVKQFNRDSAAEFEIWRENIEAAYRITGTYVSYQGLRELTEGR